MRLGTRVTFRGGLVWAMGLFLVAAVVGSLALYGDTRTLVVDGLGIVAVWMSAGVCWLAVSRVGLRHPEVTLPAAAVTSLAIGLTYLAVVVVGGRPVPLVSPADVATLLFYPLMLAALVVAVRRHVRGLASSVWLDCAVGIGIRTQPRRTGSSHGGGDTSSLLDSVDSSVPKGLWIVSDHLPRRSVTP